jgi:endonuclease/exonuclease/phosphatase family metal-dependent hydrolase
MWAKLLIAALCATMIACALRFQPARERTLLATRPKEGARLRLMTWNIGYAELEEDTRAHTQDLKAVAETILKQDADAVALQELTGEGQLKLLLGYLGGRYRGAVTPHGNTDRVEAVLVKDRAADFTEIRGGDQHEIAATFHLTSELPELVLVSAHADAFNAARRRAFTADVLDWALSHTDVSIVFIAGDFNFEVTSTGETNFYTDNLKHDSESYSSLLKHYRDLGRDAGDTAINDRRIDYIFAPPERVLLKRAEVLRDAAVGRMDHWPLVVEVTL